MTKPPITRAHVMICGGWQSRQNQAANLLLIGIPFVGSIFAINHIVRHGVSLIDISAFLVFYVLVGLGVALGFHRYFSHRSFATGTALSAILAAFGTMAFQGSVERWVSDHRRHHACADQPGDVHSPIVRPDGQPWAKWRGFLHAHIGWMFANSVTDLSIYGKGLVDDPVIRFFSRTHILWLIASLGLPYLYGLMLGGEEAAWSAMLIGGCLRTTILHNVVWAVNSVGHLYGSADFETGDNSRNNLILALLTFGDGWHNGHHRFPRSHRHGLLPRQWDANAVIIKTLKRSGLVWDIVEPSARNSPDGLPALEKQ